MDKLIEPNSEHNNVIGLMSGCIGGFFTYLLQIKTSFIGNVMLAAITAFICGAAGVAGKEAFVFIKKFIQKKKGK